MGRCARCSSPAAAADKPNPTAILRALMDDAQMAATYYQRAADDVNRRMAEQARTPPTVIDS